MLSDQEGLKSTMDRTLTLAAQAHWPKVAEGCICKVFLYPACPLIQCDVGMQVRTNDLPTEITFGLRATLNCGRHEDRLAPLRGPGGWVACYRCTK